MHDRLSLPIKVLRAECLEDIIFKVSLINQGNGFGRLSEMEGAQWLHSVIGFG
jgi:hypothetical protein